MLCTALDLLNYVIPVLITLGVVYFVWGVVQYVIGGGEEAKTKGRNTMVFGIIGLAIIIAMWGLTYAVARTFRLDGYVAPRQDQLRGMLPELPQ